MNWTHDQLEKLGYKKMSKYSDQLRNPRWQRKRLQIFERDGWKCCLCGDENSELHVHHTYYAKGKRPWEYPNEDLVTYCNHCHTKRHFWEDSIGIVVPWVVYQEEYQSLDYPLLLLERIEKSSSDDYPDIYYCKTLYGGPVVCDASGAAFKLSEGKKGKAWDQWANDFRELIKEAQ